MSKNTLYFIGLGLFDEQDLTLKALHAISKCDQVFAEFYTSTMMGTTIQALEHIIRKKISILSREETEKANIIFSSLKNGNIAFLTGGDSMAATTHVDIRIRAIKNGFRTEIIHGTSVLTAVPGLLGLQHYKFGRITTLVTPENNYFPTSPYDVIKQNKKNGLHTLILLDIQQNKHNFLTATVGINLLLQMEEIRKEQVIKFDDLICVVARAGSRNPFIKCDVISNMINQDFGPPLHTIVYPGKLHFMEKEALSIFSLR
jgi:diphthine synthase